MDPTIDLMSKQVGAGLSSSTTSRLAIAYVAVEGGAAGAILGGVVGSLISNSRRGTTWGALIGAVLGTTFGAFAGFEVKQAASATSGG